LEEYVERGVNDCRTDPWIWTTAGVVFEPTLTNAVRQLAVLIVARSTFAAVVACRRP
jgi:hypothetical protein